MAHAEDMLISAIVRTGDMKEVVRQGITADMFRRRDTEFRWIQKFFERHGVPPTGAQYKSKFGNPVYKVVGIATQCDEFRESYARSALSEILDDTVTLMMEDDTPRAVRELGVRLFEVQAKIAEAPDDYDTSTDWGSTVELVEQRVKRVETFGMAGIPTGFPSLDAVTGGLQGSWLAVVGGRLGHGKTYTTIKMAVEAACAGYKVAYFSLEQSRHQIAIRSHAFFGKKFNGGKVFPPHDLLRGVNVDVKDYAKFLGKVSRNLSGSLVINDTRRGRVSPMTIAAALERHDHDIVFVDYLTLMDTGGDGGWQNLANLTAEMKSLAERYEKPIVVVSQLNRRNEEGMSSSRLSRTDSLGHDADLVLILSQRSEHVVHHRLDKFRHGPDGIQWFCEYDPGKGVYKEVSGNKAGELMDRDKDVD